MFRVFTENRHEEFKLYQKKIAFLDKHYSKTNSSHQRYCFHWMPRDAGSYMNSLSPGFLFLQDTLIEANNKIMKSHYLEKPLMENIKNFLDAHGYLCVVINSEVFLQDPMTHIIIQQINSLSLEELNQQDEHGDTALHYAIYSHNVHIVKALHLRGVDLDIENNKGATPLACGIVRLANFQYVSADAFDAVRYLVEKTKANQNKLAVNLKEHLSEFQRTNWKTKRQLEEERKYQESLQLNENRQNNSKAFKESEKSFLQDNLYFDADIAIKEEISIARLVARSVVLHRYAENENKEKFYEVFIKTLDKLIAELPLLERMLYIYARMVKQEIGNQTSPHILAVEGCCIYDYFPSATKSDATVGIYLGDIVAFVLNNHADDFISACELYLDGTINRLPHSLCIMIHEIMHMLINKFYENGSKISPPAHLNENWKLDDTNKKCIKQDFDTAQEYVRENPKNDIAIEILGNTVSAFPLNNTTGKALSGYHIPTYSEELITTEMPALFIEYYVTFQNSELMEKMFPNTMKLLVDTLNKMYIHYQEKFPESNIIQSNAHLLDTLEEYNFNLMAEAALMGTHISSNSNLLKLSFFKSPPATPTQNVNNANNNNSFVNNMIG